MTATTSIWLLIGAIFGAGIGVVIGVLAFGAYVFIKNWR